MYCRLRPPAVTLKLQTSFFDDGAVVLRSRSTRSCIHQDETNEPLWQRTVVSAKRVGVFNIEQRRRTQRPGTRLAFHQSAISSFFWEGVVILLCRPHGARRWYKAWTKLSLTHFNISSHRKHGLHNQSSGNTLKLFVTVVFKFWADETFETKKLQERPK